VLRPLPVVLTNMADDVVEYRDAPSFPHDVRERAGELPATTAAGHEATRGLPFSNRLLIERDDFMERPSRGYHRLSPGALVRLRHGPIVRCDDVVRDGRLDLWTSAERALRAAGVERVDRFDLCTSCDEARFFSHRRDAGLTGRQGVIAYVA